MSEIPPVLIHCIDEGARRLGRALELLEWPNAGTDAPCHEVNALINILYYLHGAEPPFFTYAEGTLPNRGRIDLLGFNTQIAIAMEAKAWGRINPKSDEALADWRRMASFRPQLSEVAGEAQALDWWAQASERWRMLVISSFRGEEVKEAWLSDDETFACERMGRYLPAEHCREIDGQATGFLALWREIAPRWRRASWITDGVRWSSGSGWVLWAAAPL